MARPSLMFTKAELKLIRSRVIYGFGNEWPPSDEAIQGKASVALVAKIDGMLSAGAPPETEKAP